MAVKFTPDSGTGIIIGGEINPANGIPGPFPTYSISRTPIRKDSILLGSTYEISVSGTALINSTVDMMVVGERQNAIHDLIKEILFTGGKKGELEIAPYGGKSNVLLFSNAVLISADAPEQDDSSQGVQYQNYSFTFSSDRLSVNGQNIDDNNTVEQDLDDISETWDISFTDGDYDQTDFEASAVNAVQRKWSISNTISATGRSQSDGTSGYLQAKEYVEGRLSTLGNNPLVAQDLSLTPVAIDFGITDPLYVAYDQVDQTSQDLLAGTYSVTRTWIISKAGAAGMKMSFDFSNDQTAEFQTVSVSLTVSGYETEGPASTYSQRYMNAKTKFDNTKSSVANWASLFYAAQNELAGGALRAKPSAESQSHDQTNGVITYSATFDDAVIEYAGAISESVSITYNNEDGGNQTVAIIPVIAKANGPVIQDMATTNEATRSISVELQMDRDNRSSKPDGASVANQYVPVGTTYRQNKTETWNPKSGAYSYSVDYVFVAGDAK